jgi:hypothetical protein
VVSKAHMSDDILCSFGLICAFSRRATDSCEPSAYGRGDSIARLLGDEAEMYRMLLPNLSESEEESGGSNGTHWKRPCTIGPSTGRQTHITPTAHSVFDQIQAVARVQVVSFGSNSESVLKR